MLRHPEHIVQFYSNDDALLDVWGRVLGDAIEAGEGAICVATTTHQEGLAKRLEQRGQGSKIAADQGRYLSLNATETLSAMMPEGQLDVARVSEFFGSAIDKARTAVRRDAPRVVVLGEMVALLWSKGKYDDVLRLENLRNSLGQTQGVSVRCGYPMRAFNHQRDNIYFQRICAEHSAVFLPESLPVFSSEEGRVHPQGTLDQVIAQAEELIQKDDNLPYPCWQVHYRTCLLETDRSLLFKKVEIAEAAVLTRLHELQPGKENLVERQQLIRARTGLQIIKKHKLGFS